MTRLRKILPLLVFLSAAHPAFPQHPGHFYNVDTEIKVEGIIKDISLEPRYKDRSPFLVVTLEERLSKDIYTVEISPSWFFGEDVHKGENLEVTGSVVSTADRGKILIARQIRFRGETIDLRDRQGFPSWRGGPDRKGRRRGRGI